MDESRQDARAHRDRVTSLRERTRPMLSFTDLSPVPSAPPATTPALRPHAGSAASATSLSLSQVVAALAHALDLTEGQPAGHALRTCLIGMRLAEQLALDDSTRGALYYALLLKDAGCSSNAARFAALFGSDDQTVKYRMKLVDWHQRLRLALQTARTVGLGRSLPTRIRHFAAIARTENMTRDLIRLRCERGAAIALQLGFPAATAEAIRSLDEHWSGQGYPSGRRGTAIPLLARIANLAQVVDLFCTAYGLDAALTMARVRRGTWFDPRLVDLLLGWGDDRAWWEGLGDGELAARVIGAEPARQVYVLDDARLDTIVRGFAGIIDAKSPYTAEHSSHVAAYALAIARQLGLDPTQERPLYRAGLLHDIGKLGLSNRILDKPGPLTAAERRAVAQHPIYTWEILARVPAFDDFARTAALHHEKLDGSGYPWGLRGNQLDPPARILAVADSYSALTVARPYRRPVSPKEALAILWRGAGTAYCATAIGGLEAAMRSGRIEEAPEI